MLPIPTGSSRIVFFICVVVLAVGIGTQTPAVLMLAGTGFVGLALALGATMPLGRRVRRQRLEFAWWLGPTDPVTQGTAVVSEAPFQLQCYVRNRGSELLRVGGLNPIANHPGVTVTAAPLAAEFPARSRSEFSFHVRASSVGRVVFHGLAMTLRGPLGAFEVPLYFPNPLVVRVLPRAATRRWEPRRWIGGLSGDQTGGNLARRRGGGTELYELRDLLPGDPFKSIAWKASARSGRLIVREVEDQIQQTRWLIMDVGRTMRTGEPGFRRLDDGIETAAAEARNAIDAGHRVGLTIVDGKVLAQLSARAGASHLLSIYDALLASTQVVDPDLIVPNASAIVHIVGRYVRSQDGIDFRRRDSELWNVPALARHCARYVNEVAPARAKASDLDEHAVLRRYCFLRGLDLDYRGAPNGQSRADGLASALQDAGGATREPSNILVISDLGAVQRSEALVATLKLVRAHRHRLSFYVPAEVSLPRPRTAVSELDRTTQTVARRRDRNRIQEARDFLNHLGLPVLLSTPRSPRTTAPSERASEPGDRDRAA